MELFRLMIGAMIRSHEVAVDELAMSGMAGSNREGGEGRIVETSGICGQAIRVWTAEEYF